MSYAPRANSSATVSTAITLSLPPPRTDNGGIVLELPRAHAVASLRPLVHLHVGGVCAPQELGGREHGVVGEEVLVELEGRYREGHRGSLR